MPQHFSGKNLRGQSFKGQNLTGADFSGSDIRGTNFAGTVLRSAKFSCAQGGLQKQSTIFLIVILSFVSATSLYFAAFTQTLINLIFNYSTQYNQIIGWGASAVLVIFFLLISIFAIRQEFKSNRTFAITEAFAGIFGFAFVGIIAIAVAVLALGYQAIAVAISVTGVFAFSIIFVTVGGITVTAAGAVAGVKGIAIAATFAAIGGVANIGFKNILVAGILALAAGLFFAYSACKTLQDNEKKYNLTRIAAIALAAFGGTSFYNADLSDADFTGATLKSTDFRKANLTHTCFYKAKKLDRIRPGSTYLHSLQVRQLLVSRKVANKNFDNQNLSGVNFKEVDLEGASFKNANLADANFQKANLVNTSFIGANMRGINFQRAYLTVIDESFIRANLSSVNFQGAYLVNVSFIGADLSEANFQDADLSRAKLVKTQLDGTDFTGATLTGAYIEDWNITRSTKFNGVQCKFVYTRLPTEDNPDPHRKPDNREEVFGDGEFSDFIQPIFDTLDLYHNQGYPRAMAAAFKQLAQNNPSAELEIVAIERRGEDKVLLRARTARTADKSELSKEYFLNYNQLKALAEQDFKILIAKQESQISKLETMIMTALERPNFYSEGDIIMPGSSKNKSNLDLQGAQFDGSLINADTLNANQIGGGINNVAQEQTSKINNPGDA